jgi:hypothetical protein
VLGTPPAFNLSQDQTLHLKISIINQWLKKDSLLDFFGHSVFALEASTRVPTQITCKFLKSVPAARARVVRIAALQTSTSRLPRTVRRGAHYSHEL